MMPSLCCVEGCSNKSSNGYLLVNFPKNMETKKKWIAALNRPDWYPKPHDRLCEVHFAHSDVQFVAGRRQIRKDAVPIYFCTDLFLASRAAKIKKLLRKVSPTSDHSYSCTNDILSSRRQSLQSLQVNGINDSSSQQYQTSDHSYCLVGKRYAKLQISNRPCDALPNKQVSKCTVFKHLDGCCIRKSPINLKDLQTSDAGPDNKILHNLEETLRENVRLKEELCKLKKHLNIAGKVLSPDQWEALQRGHHRGSVWSDASILQGLSFNFACGATGYNFIQKTLPLPSPLTLQRRIQHITT